MSDTEKIKKSWKEWEERYAASRLKDKLTDTTSQPVKPLYTPMDVQDLDYSRDLGMPGEYPFTRGVQTSMYRGRTWTMRQFAGFGTAKDTNQRYKYLLKNGQTGLSVAFDFPTLYGYDSDHARSIGEVGRCGVAISSLKDMETLFDGIPLDKVSTSMTINGPAAVLWAFYICVGEKQGVSSDKLRGTIQNDILKEYIAQKSWIFPPRPSMRIITDILGYAVDNVPLWNTISISGYHIREAGSTAVQELAFTLADGFAYVEAGIEAGLDVDKFAPRLSYFFNSHTNFFEEIAKYRAARRIWAKRLKEKYNAKNPKSWLLRFHTQTAGCSLTAQQPENNIVRTAYQALSAVLGGTQSLHTNSMDETLALPTEKSVKIALRTQQIIEDETGAADVIDPLAGSYFVEALTDEMERRAEEYFERIEELGGVVEAIEKGFFQREIADAAYRYQQDLENNRRFMIGINKYVDPDEKIDIPLLKIDQKTEDEQVESVKKLKSERDQALCDANLAKLGEAAKGKNNLMPFIIECARSYCTLGEIIQVLKDEFGEYVEPPIF